MMEKDTFPRRLDRRPFETVLRIAIGVFVPLGCLAGVFLPRMLMLGVIVGLLFVIAAWLVRR